MNTPRESTTLTKIILRMYWMFIGPLISMIAAIMMLTHRQDWSSVASVFCIVNVGLIVVVRGLEFQMGDPLTSLGTPATMTDFKRFAFATLAIGLTGWLMLHLIISLL